MSCVAETCIYMCVCVCFVGGRSGRIVPHVHVSLLFIWPPPVAHPLPTHSIVSRLVSDSYYYIRSSPPVIHAFAYTDIIHKNRHRHPAAPRPVPSRPPLGGPRDGCAYAYALTDASTSSGVSECSVAARDEVDKRALHCISPRESVHTQLA